MSKMEDALGDMFDKKQLTITGYYYLLTVYRETLAGETMKR